MSNIHEPKTALAEFLELHPELAPFQKEVERRLAGAATEEDKLTIIRMMITESTKALQDALLKLGDVPKIKLDF